MPALPILEIGVTANRPLVGLKPPYIYAEECRLRRLADIADAVHRYMLAHEIVPLRWLKEYEELVSAAPKEDLHQRSFTEANEQPQS